MGLLDQLNSFAQGASNSVAGGVSAPVDGIAWLLRKAGVPVPTNPVGGSDWMAQQGLTAQPKQHLAGLLGEGIGGAMPSVIAAKAPQIAGGLLQGARNLATPNVMNPQAGAIVWHGSPHTFDKFDASKIGTGEGAQAYGHGLYLADSPAVATSYQRGLSDIDMFVGGKPFENADPYHRAALAINEANENGHAIPDVVARLQRSANELKSRGHAWANDLASEQLGTAQAIQSGKVPQYTEASKGSLYKVDLPDEHIAKMLNWDAPLSEQADVLKNLTPSWQGGNAKSTPFAGDASMTGQQLWNTARQMNGTPGGAAKWLNDLNIPGIRYLDGGSRTAADGTRNSVLFPGNEGLLNILERNGQPLR